MYMMKNMEEILKTLMNTRCVAMHNPSMRCYGKECNGQCANFQVALQALDEHELNAVKFSMLVENISFPK